MNFKLLQKEAKKAGVEAIELYEKQDKKINISAFDNQINEKTEANTKVFAIRGVYNNQLATIYTEKDDDNEIPNLIKRLIEVASYLTNDEPYFIYPGDKNYATVELPVNELEKMPLAEKSNLLLKITKMLKDKTNLYFHGEAEYEEISGKISIINSNGLDVTKEYKYALLYGAIIVKNDNEMKNAYEVKYLKTLDNLDLDAFTNKIVDKAISQINAKSIKSGAYKVVIQNNVLNNLMGAFVNNFSALKVKHKMSFLENKLNKQIFGKNINLIDDPFYKDAPMIDTFDDEGVSTKVKEVVKDGVLQTYFHNLSTASYYNVSPTGNGFKNSPSGDVDIYPCNLYLEGGSKNFTQLLETVDDGVLITSVTGLHAGVNPISGDFNLQCSGYLIKNGKRDLPITLIVLSGNFIDMLNNIAEIANDNYYFNGMAMPSVYVKSMNISGN